MSRAKPYQPLILRLIHGINAAIAVLAIITSFLVYNTFDGRFGRLPLPQIPNIIDIHGTLGVFFLFSLPILAIYSFHVGHKRLIQPDSFDKLTQVGKPIWWYSLHRIVNTTMLLAATFALISGRMMKEEWLPTGELDRTWYQLHLLGWVILVICLAIHLLMASKVGGTPLLVSMFSWKYRTDDSPATWFRKIRSRLRRS